MKKNFIIKRFLLFINLIDFKHYVIRLINQLKF